MAKRQQVTKLLAVMAMASSPALAGPGHGHEHGHARAPAGRAPAGEACEGAEAAARPPPRTPVRAAPAARAGQAGQAGPAMQSGAAVLEAILTMFGVARPRELPNGRPAPGNVGSRVPARDRSRR